MSMKEYIAERNEAERVTQEKARNVNRLRVWRWKKERNMMEDYALDCGLSVESK